MRFFPVAEQLLQKVRLDKWLWAARFFKTRALAKAAIEGGKIHVDGQRAKPSKEITTGMMLEIRQGWDEKTVAVEALSEQRRGASEAAKLYKETTESIEQRTRRAEERKAANQAVSYQDHRPNKKERRLIHRFKEQNL
jgi:ribosome-associated heat shock protein Hsp15